MEFLGSVRLALRDILTEPKNSIIRQYIYLFKLDGVDLSFTDDALDFIVDKAIEYKLGARGLRSIVESIMTEPMFEVPSTEQKKLVVDKEFAKKQIEKTNLNILSRQMSE